MNVASPKQASHHAATGSQTRLRRWGPPSVWLLVVAIAAIVGVRFVHLEADSPLGLPDDIGLYVDEGYKTLAPRNLVLFGEVRWNAEDDYPGWMKSSAVTQNAFLASFSAFGQNLGSARLVSILWFGLFLTALAVALKRNYPPRVLWTGLLMVGLHHVLWVYSRVAIIEIAGVALLFGTLLLLRAYTDKLVPTVLIFTLMGTVAALTVKLNAAYVLASGLVGMVVSIASSKLSERRLILLILGSMGLILAPALLVKFGVQLPVRGLTGAVSMVDLFPPTEIIKRFLVHPILLADPFLVVLTSTSALGLLLHRSKTFSGSMYRSALLGIVLLGTAILAMMSWSPLRYWIFLLPAYLLLIVEWQAEQEPAVGETTPALERRGLGSVAAVGVLVILAFGCLYTGVLLLKWVFATPEPRGMMVWVMLLVAGLAALVVWRFRESLLTERALRRFSYGTLVALVMFNVYKIGSYVSNPAWEIQTIRQQLAEVLPPDSVLAGDWAPVFSLGTQQRALYMNSRFNRPERVKLTRPTHFLYCQSDHRGVDDGAKVLNLLEQTEGLQVGAPMLETSYIGRKVVLYPLKYDDEPETAAARPEQGD